MQFSSLRFTKCEPRVSSCQEVETRANRVQARPEPIGRALRVRAVFLRKIRLLPHPDHIREFSPKGCFVEADQRDLVCPLPFAKIFPFLSKANHFISRAVSLLKGAYRDRHERGAGCGGREAARKTNARASRTAESCGPDAPTLASSWRKYFRWRQWQQSPVTGESAKETVKTTARGMPGVTGVTVVTMLVCFFILHARLRAHRAPGIPAPSDVSDGRTYSKTRAHAARSWRCVC